MKKYNRLFMYAKGATLSLLTLVACSKSNDGEILSGPMTQKVEKAVTHLKTQNKTAVDFSAVLQNTKQPKTRSSSLDDKVAEQQAKVDSTAAVHETAYNKMVNGVNAVPGFAKAEQKHADMMGLNLDILEHRALTHHDFAINIQKNEVAAIPYSSLDSAQKNNLKTFEQSAYDLRRALEVLNRLTGGVERAEQQVNGLHTWIHELSVGIVDVLETATGTRIATHTTKGAPLPTEQVLQKADALMTTMTEEDLAPHNKEITRINQEIESVQAGLDELLNFWETFEQESTAQNFAAKNLPVKMAQYNKVRTL